MDRARKWWGAQAVGVGGHSPEPQGEQREPAPYDESPVTQGPLSLRGQRSRQPHLTPCPPAHWQPLSLPSFLMSMGWITAEGVSRPATHREAGLVAIPSLSN